VLIVAAVVSQVVNAQLVTIGVKVHVQVLHINKETLQICFHYEQEIKLSNCVNPKTTKHFVCVDSFYVEKFLLSTLNVQTQSAAAQLTKHKRFQ